MTKIDPKRQDLILQKKEKEGVSKLITESNNFFNDKYLYGDRGKEVDDIRSCKITMFEYYPDKPDILSFYDLHPVIIPFGKFTAESTSNDIIEGINLMFLPPKIRKDMLDQISKYLIGNKGIRDDENYYEYLKYIFIKLRKTDFKFAIRRYILDNISEAKEINRTDYWCLVYLKPLNIMGKKPDDIYAEYYKNLKPL